MVPGANASAALWTQELAFEGVQVSHPSKGLDEIRRAYQVLRLLMVGLLFPLYINRISKDETRVRVK